MKPHCVIIGASHAAAQLVVSLRQSGWDGGITLIGEEQKPPYHRPPLSKDYLSDQKPEEQLFIRPKEIYEQNNVTLKLGVRVHKIDRKSKIISTNQGDEIAYDKLVLTTGARVRKLAIDGADLPGIHYLRDIADVNAIKTSVANAERAVIIGGGYIGLETAASLQKMGLAVTILEAMPRILQRVTAPELSDFYRRIHTEEGVVIKEGVKAISISQTKTGLNVVDISGNIYPADFVIVGIGVLPNTELATDAGLEVANGIVVNGFCQTSDPDIYAAGDVTWHYNVKYDRHLRLESVPNATEQAKVVADHLCGGAKVYDSLPWFWSDQYDLKLQIAGLSEGYTDLVFRGDPAIGRSFAAFYFEGPKLIAVDAINAPREFAMARMLLSKGANLDKVKLSDTSLSLKDLVL